VLTKVCNQFGNETFVSGATARLTLAPAFTSTQILASTKLFRPLDHRLGSRGIDEAWPRHNTDHAKVNDPLARFVSSRVRGLRRFDP
jgi:hypothetical protein